jgi:hypothetical protein
MNKQFFRFDKIYINLFKEIVDCIHTHKEDVEHCESFCIGPNFKKVKERFKMNTYRVKSMFENIVQVLFNDNCLNDEKFHEVCKQMWDDIRVLDYYNLETLLIFSANQIKYIDDEFTEEEFQRIYDLIEILYNKMRKFMEDREDVRMVMLGRIYEILEIQTRPFKKMGHTSIVNDPSFDKIDEQQFGYLFSMKLDNEFKNPNSSLNDPDSSLDDQVANVSLWDTFKTAFEPRIKEPHLSPAEKNQIERSFETNINNESKNIAHEMKEYGGEHTEDEEGDVVSEDEKRVDQILKGDE